MAAVRPPRGGGARLGECGLTARPASSGLQRVLGGDARDPGERRPGKPKRRSEAGAVIAHLGEQVEQIRAQDLPVRLDPPDAVHEMGVATRRLRSALTTSEPLFDTEVVGPLRGELKWLAAEPGAGRDAEVLRVRVAAAVGTDDAAGAAGEQARAELHQACNEAHDRVLADLDGERHHQLLQALDQLVGVSPTTGRAARPAGKELPRRVGRSFTVVANWRSRQTPARPGARNSCTRPARMRRRPATPASRSSGSSARTPPRPPGRWTACRRPWGAPGLRAHAAAAPRAGGRRLLHRGRLLYGRLHALEEARGERHRRRFADAWKAARRKSVRRWTR